MEVLDEGVVELPANRRHPVRKLLATMLKACVPSDLKDLREDDIGLNLGQGAEALAY